MAAHVPEDDGVRPEGRRDGGDQRRGHRAVGHARQGRGAAGIPAARRPHQASAFPVYASRLYSQPLDELAAEARSTRTQGYQRDEAALRLGTGRRRRGHAAQRRAGAHGARSRRRRDRHHGRRLHGLESRLREADDAAARAVQPALARGAGDSRRHARLRRAARRRPHPDRRRRARVHAFTGSAICSSRARSTTSSSTPTASAASRRRERSRRWPRRTRCRSCRTPGRCTTTTS